MSNEHTPTTLEIRKAFINLDGTFANGSWDDGSLKRFDRWYQDEISAAEQRGAIKALRHEADNLIGHGSVWPIESVAGVTAAARKLHRRADEMESKNEQHLL